MITRLAVEPYPLHGRTIPAGAIVGVDLRGLAHDPSLFPDPDRYQPSRWLGRSGPPSPSELFQFGAGPHFCLGYHLAWLTAVQLSVTLARELGQAGMRLRLRGEMPRPIFLPTEHPPVKTVVELVRDGWLRRRGRGAAVTPSVGARVPPARRPGTDRAARPGSSAARAR
jgi:hypothetical protein